MQRSLLAASLGLALAGCAGSAMAPVPAAPSAPSPLAIADGNSDAAAMRPDAARAATISLGARKAAGGAITALADENASERPAAKTPKGSGVCRNGVEFYAPDRAGDPNSTETEFFYTASCSRLARDAVRRFTPSGSNAETVSLTASNYALDGAALWTRTSTVQFSDATFAANGWPVAAGGFVREAQSRLVAGRRTIEGDNEFVVRPSVDGVTAFCSDWAGYNVDAVARLNETFGWAGGFLSGGTRTVNSDGSVTWTGSRNATLYEAPIGGLSITQGAVNSACPIATPAYSIAGGSAKGSSIGTTTVTFDDGWIRSLSISRTSLSGGYALTASSNSGVWAASPNFITGTVRFHGKTVATFAVNAIGDGTLTVTATGARYYLLGWTVIR